MEPRLVNVGEKPNGHEIDNLAGALLPSVAKSYVGFRERDGVQIYATCSRLMGLGNNYRCEFSVERSNDNRSSKLVVEIEGIHGETSDRKELELKVSGKK
jgi:hypothetical protein